MTENDINHAQILSYVLGWLSAAETTKVTIAINQHPHYQKEVEALQAALFQLQASWIQQQAQTHQQQQSQHHHIQQWVQGDLPAPEIAQLKQAINTDPALNSYYHQVQTLWQELQNIERFSWSEWLQTVRQAITPPPSLTPSQQWAARGNRDTPLLLPLDPDYSLEITLFMGRQTGHTRLVEGQITDDDPQQKHLTPLLDQAHVWLLPYNDDEGGWDTTVDQFGTFVFPDLPPGAYALEMAWPGHFLEVLDVAIPHGG